MGKTDAVFEKVREICLSLPDTKETRTWGQPHFRVGDKIFCGYGEEKGKQVLGFKLEMEHADMMLGDARFWRAPYVGHKGWVSMDAAKIDDWEEVRLLILESYRLIAPKKTFAKFLEAAPPRAPAKKLTKARPAKARPAKTRASKRASSSGKPPKRTSRKRS